MTDSLDLSSYFLSPDAKPARVSPLTAQLQGSQILRIAAEIRAKQASGDPVCNLSVGDYSPAEFPMPKALIAENIQSFEKGQTNYPPAIGTPQLRDAVSRYYQNFLGLSYPRSGVVITSGARSVVYALFRAVVEKGETVINPTPSWNLHYYTRIAQANNLIVESRPEDGFLTTRERLEAHVSKARVLCLCSPSNPSGTLFDEQTLAGICDLVLEENARRQGQDRPLFVLYDHVYWPITHGGRKHLTPVNLRPEMAKYTVFVDGISKAFAATGVRVGWGVGPPDIISGMAKYTGHAGAWAPKPGQLATARFLDQVDAVKDAFKTLQSALEARLGLLVNGLKSLTAKDLPLHFIEPQGALYLTLQLKIEGRKTPSGQVLANNEDIRRYLLESAGMGIVPFEAFGRQDALGWFRVSVGAVSAQDIEALIPRLEAALKALV